GPAGMRLPCRSCRQDSLRRRRTRQPEQCSLNCAGSHPTIRKNMNRTQFAVSLAVMAFMSLVGSFVAVYALQGAPVQAQEEGAGVVMGSEFVLVDKKGNTRASLDLSDDNEVRFTLIDSEGKGRVQLSSGGERAYIALLDRSQQIRYLVGQDDTTVMETMLDAKGKNRVISQFQDSGETLLAFNGADGNN